MQRAVNTNYSSSCEPVYSHKEVGSYVAAEVRSHHEDGNLAAVHQAKQIIYKITKRQRSLLPFSTKCFFRCVCLTLFYGPIQLQSCW